MPDTIENMKAKLEWYALLAKAGGLGDFAIGFIEGDRSRPVGTLGYYEEPFSTEDVDENMLPIETPERRALLEKRLADCMSKMHNGGHRIDRPIAKGTADKAS